MKITVQLQGQDPFDIDATNPDRVRWDMTAAQKKWPTMTDAPFLGLTFMAWAAMRRLGHYAGTWEKFWETDCLDVTAEKADEDDDVLDPTQQVAQLD